MKPGKYDPPNKAQILKEHPGITVLGQVFCPPPKTQFSPFLKVQDEAPRARMDGTVKIQNQDSSNQKKRGRKPIVTAEKIQLICKAISEGNTEKGACLKAAIGLTAWNNFKRLSLELRNQIQEAKSAWAELRYKQLQAARYESQCFRLAGKKALKPQPTHQAKMVQWHLTFRVPLNYAAIPENEIKIACERFNYSVDQWQRQSAAFSLMHKVYAKRAKLRGDELLQSSQSANWKNTSVNNSSYKTGGFSLGRG